MSYYNGKVIERFLDYVSYPTASEYDMEDVPSTKSQFALAERIAAELKEIGLEGVRVDERCYVYGFLPASAGCEGLPCIGFIGHMDTSPDAPGENIKPRIIKYEGGDIDQGCGSIAVRDFPFLKNYVGQRLIITDGTTLLGADDKAGVSEIVSAVEYLADHPEIKHPRIAVGFTPDEEVGRGADFFDIKGFGAEFGYTVDGGTLGELEYENFNAAAALLKVKGLNIHPGSAKGKMKNAVLIASEFVSMLPEDQTPARTEGYEGFFHVQEIQGDETSATVKMLVRDHDMAKFTAKKELLKELESRINEKYGEGTAECAVKDSYYNMKEKILPVMHIIRRAEDALRAAGVEPVTVPIRGGTDGARLSYEGLPCPNLCTGGENYHSVKEFVSADAMEKMVEVIVNIAKAQ
ncbi:MAG: peptidase T [Firmicutes bacterium]|nr:peptidase T [Bacillota bacterium]